MKAINACTSSSLLALVAFVALLPAAGGCSKPETKTESNPAASEIKATMDAAVVVMADAAIAPVAAAEPEEPLPTHAEEETQAAQEIQKANYKQELDRLAKEIENP